MQVAFAACLALALSLTTLSEGEREFRVVDMVVARVDASVITLSELIGETRIVLLRTHGPERAAQIPLTRELLSAVLKAMVSRELLLAEARRLQLREVPEAEVRGAARQIQTYFATLGDYVRFLERFGYSLPAGAGELASTPIPPALAAMLRAERQVERFIALRVRPNVAIRDEEIRRCYERNRAKLGAQPLERVREVIERAIQEERAESTVAVLVEQLERKATIRYAGDLRPDLATEEDQADLGLRCTPPKKSRR